MKITLLGACIGIALLGGLFFRFYHIDRKVFWDDEVYSSIRIVGYREDDVIRQAATARTAMELQAILHPGPSERKASLQGTINGLMHEEPQHPPIYFAMAHVWSNSFGNSVRALRLFSAVIGVLAIPAMFWLCFELLGSMRAGWIGAALMACSPVAVLYSQQIRDYCLWTVALLVMGASLLRAVRLQTASAWALYTVALAFGLYVYLLSIVTALGFLLFVAVDRSKPFKTKLYALISFAAGLLVFSPWLIILTSGLDAVRRGTATILEQRMSAAYILGKLIASLRLNFFDYNLQSWKINLPLSIPLMVLVGYALFFCRTLTRRPCAFIVTLLAFAIVPLVGHDILFGGALTAQTRYFIPAYLACDLALVGLFNSVLAQATNGISAVMWRSVFVVLIAARLSSCAASAQAATWWTTFDERSIEIARTINASARPIFISDNYIGYVLSVAEYLRPNVAVNIRSVCYLCTAVGHEAPDHSNVREELAESSDVYLLGPSAELQERVRTALGRSAEHARYWCIDVRANCISDLRLWHWIQ